MSIPIKQVWGKIVGNNECKRISTDILAILIHSTITKYQYLHTSKTSIAINNVKSSKKDDKKYEYEGSKSPIPKRVYSFDRGLRVDVKILRFEYFWVWEKFCICIEFQIL